jgi:hypothetical protein
LGGAIAEDNIDTMSGVIVNGCVTIVLDPLGDTHGSAVSIFETFTGIIAAVL